LDHVDGNVITIEEIQKKSAIFIEEFSNFPTWWEANEFWGSQFWDTKIAT